MLFDDVKKFIRKTNNSFDDEIKNVIDFVRKDLFDIGILVFDESDPKIVAAVKYKARAEFNFNNKADYYEKMYNDIKITLKCQGAYTDAR